MILILHCGRLRSPGRASRGSELRERTRGGGLALAWRREYPVGVARLTFYRA
jgi:hypothetical protein